MTLATATVNASRCAIVVAGFSTFRCSFCQRYARRRRSMVICLIRFLLGCLSVE